MRIISQIDTGAISSIGVPCTGTKALMWVLSGCGLKLDKATNIPALSYIASPMPIIPPLQTVTLVLRTFYMVSNLSWKALVEITSL